MNRLATLFASAVLMLAVSAGTFAAAPTVTVGQRAPSFTYRLIDGKTLSPKVLRGHRYMLWVMATWCPSCISGADVVAQHIAELRARKFLVLQMEAAGDLGYPGPSLASIRHGIGGAGHSSNWYWGQLTQSQSLAIDPGSSPDVFYLVDEHGRVVAQGSAPAASWDDISKFANRG